MKSKPITREKLMKIPSRVSSQRDLAIFEKSGQSNYISQLKRIISVKTFLNESRGVAESKVNESWSHILSSHLNSSKSIHQKKVRNKAIKFKRKAAINKKSNPIERSVRIMGSSVARYSKQNSPRIAQRPVHRSYNSCDFSCQRKLSSDLEAPISRKSSIHRQSISRINNLMEHDKTRVGVILFRPPSLIRSSSLKSSNIKRSTLSGGFKKASRRKINLSADFIPFAELANHRALNFDKHVK
ncbi:unnamed protein product [Blepharisma stoltei]|uniref:Uncharacterized protein n=1 Tax=Blepharisma stoltei TaxID=1481888 RepID=A0AAU9JQ20_9CILI|nr:unnamed protein product [Blepharisma stoltei]